MFHPRITPHLVYFFQFHLQISNPHLARIFQYRLPLTTLSSRTFLIHLVYSSSPQSRSYLLYAVDSSARHHPAHLLVEPAPLITCHLAQFFSNFRPLSSSPISLIISYLFYRSSPPNTQIFFQPRLQLALPTSLLISYDQSCRSSRSVSLIFLYFAYHSFPRSHSFSCPALHSPPYILLNF